MPHPGATIKSRRAFIKESAMAAGMLTLLNACGHGFSSWKFALDTDSINKFKKGFNGDIILAGNTEYETARRTRLLNPEMNKYPAIIAKCKNVEDVLRCIDFAHDHELEVAVRSGNHSTLGWGTCEKGIVIDLSKMKGVTVDPMKNTVLVSTGATAEEILAATAPYGLAPVLGECGSVGAGLALGGGLGYLSGKFGATCDNLLSARIITADGRTLETNASANQDLFWAIRGGGGNFGIATAFEYQLYPVNQVLAGSFVYPIEKAHALIHFFREFMQAAPDELQGDCHYVKQGGESFGVKFVYSGDLNKGENLLNKFRMFLKPERDSVKRRPYSEVYRMAPDRLTNEVINPCQFQSVKGTYIETLSDEVIDLILNRFGQAPPSCQLFFNLSHYMHGEVCRVAPDATAFELRKPGGLNMAFLIGWDDPKKASVCMSWLNNTFEGLQSFSGGRIYANYMSTNKPSDSKAVYGSNYTRLVQLKRKYDPKNLFHLNQNISPK